MPKYIFSTLTADQLYTKWSDPVADMPRRLASVAIEGGANVATKQFTTPLGVMTTVSDEEFAILEGCVSFRNHRRRGYIMIMDKPYAVEEVVPDMTSKDGSAPLTEDNFEDTGPIQTPPATSHEALGLQTSVRSDMSQAESSEPLTGGGELEGDQLEGDGELEGGQTAEQGAR